MNLISTNEAKMEEFRKWLNIASLDVKPHQLEGMEWLLLRDEDGSGNGDSGGGILADEMGLGKTILMLGLIISNYKKRTLIVVPPAIMDQWETEIIRLLGHHPLVYHGTRKRGVTLEQIKDVPLVLTTYGMISPRKRKGVDIPNLLAKISWDRTIYDEAHHLRNPKTHKYIGARIIQSSITWLVTGTPIQNRMRDLYSLCSILTKSNVKRGNPCIDTIKRHHILRRTKKGIGLKIPDLISETILVPWKQAPEELLAENLHSTWGFTKISKRSISAIVGMLASSHLPALMRMKQVCALPGLLRNKLENFVDSGVLDEDVGLTNGAILGTEGESKMNAILSKIKERRSNGRAKIVFCQFRGVIDWLYTHLMSEGIRVNFVDGRTPRQLREDILSSNCYEVILLQIQTSCEGLNLQHFKEVYFVSPHWNPCVEDQAIARSHRIGQTDTVNVFRFAMDEFVGGVSLDNYCKQVQDEKREIIYTFIPPFKKV